MTNSLFSKDTAHTIWRAVALPLLAILAGLAVGGLVLVATGYDVITAYAALGEGIFGSTRNLGEALLRSTPLVLIGAGIAVAFRCGIWNIGAEGQFYLGAAAGTLVGLHADQVPPLVAIPVALAAGFLAGGMWASLAGWLKVRLGLNEVVTTIMLNYIAIGLIGYLVTGPMQEAIRTNPQTDEIAASAVLPRIWLPTRVTLGFPIAVAFAAVATVILFRTPFGYALRAVGFNPQAAQHAGINVNRQFLSAMLLSGGAAGLAGAIEVMGVTGRLYENISPGYGFEGIAVALLVNSHPLATVLSGLLFGALGAGSQLMQLTAKIPAVLTLIIQGLVITFLVSFRVLGRRNLRG